MAFVNASTTSPGTQVMKSGSATAAGGTVLDGNFDALNSRVPSEALLLDGSKPMAGDLDLGGNAILNLLLPATTLGGLVLGKLEFTDDGTNGHLYITLNVAGVLTRVQIV